MTAVAEKMELPEVEAEGWTAGEVLAWGFDRFHPRLALASAFGAEGMVLVDMASRIRADFRVFTLDTGFFFPETYELMGRLEERYGIRIERCRPSLTPGEQARVHGAALWSRHPDRCCEIRKVTPLGAKLAELDAWATAIRRDQSPARAAVGKVEWDSKFGLVKFNPLADWTWEEVWDYIRAYNVPYNPLHDRRYPSIGCTHCTRPVESDEYSRAGRWAGFTKLECGLHGREPAFRDSEESSFDLSRAG